ncbi:40S ribosomal protein S11 [Acorus gramineus]|uniref:Small ribosomal subunit protein uS17 n=1 Tax=Acorus gramineus TaxID=55184 RepID=A0AAV9AY96_ACOGR|nr:40S ribosomal protein S11 [Acorus gramineus]
MAEQTEKAFLKQPKVFASLGYDYCAHWGYWTGGDSSKKSGKGKMPGKGGNRFWKSVGLGFKTPREAIEAEDCCGLCICLHTTWPGAYIDKKCPFTGSVSIRGRILAGTCHSAKMNRTIIVRRNYLHYVKKYQRQRHSNIPAHVSPCFRVKEGDHVIIGQCRPLSKTVRFNVLKVIPAGSTGGGGKKGFTAA